MTVFQILGISLSGAISTLLVVAVLRGDLGRRAGLSWLGLWLFAGIAIAKPELTVSVANRLGIARGADLVFYSGILFMLIGFLALYARLRRIESSLSTIVRELAIQSEEVRGLRGDEPTPSEGPISTRHP